MTIIADDLIRRAGIQNGHAGCALEERIHGCSSVNWCGWRNTRQPFLDSTLECSFDIFAGQSGKLLHELIDLCGANIHGLSNTT